MMTVNKITEIYRHLKLEIEGKDGNVKEIEFVRKWLDDKNIKIFNRLDFIPMNKVNIKQEGDYYNLFNGWVEEVFTQYDKAKYEQALKPFIDLGTALCSENKQYFEYLIKFFAHMIQKPSERIPIAFIIKGKQGTGKNVFLNAICGLMNKKNYICSSSPNDFFGEYAEGFYHKLLVNINECEGKDTFNYEGKLKSFITEKEIMMNPKHIRPIEINNYARLVIFTNKANPIPIDVKSNDRRYIVFETSDKYLDKIYNSSFWIDLMAHFNTPQFKACLYDYLNNININNWDFKKERPITKAYLDMCKQYIPVEALYLEYLIDCKIFEKFIPDENKENDNYKKIIYANAFELYNNFKLWAQNNGYHKEHKPSTTAFYSKINDLQFPIDKVKIDGYITFKFIPENIYNYLKKRKWLSIEDGFLEDEPEIFVDHSYLKIF